MNKWVPAFFNAGKVTDSLWRRCGDPPNSKITLGVSLAQARSLERERDGHSVHVYITRIEYFTLLFTYIYIMFFSFSASSLVLYYYHAIASAHKQMVNILQEQLVMVSNILY